MKDKIILILLDKRKEDGLLSLLDGKAKSMLSMLGGVRLIDLYLSWVLHTGIFHKVYLFIDEESNYIRDYVGYFYRDSDLQIITCDNFANSFKNIISRDNDKLLILRIDPLVYFNLEQCLYLEKNTFLGVSKERPFLIYLPEYSDFIDYIQENRDILSKCADSNDLWTIFEKLDYKFEKIGNAEIYSELNNVREYFDFHMNILKDLRSGYKTIFLSQMFTSNDEDETLVGRSGRIKNSYIGMSCVIEGTIENSFIFSNNRVSKGVFVKDSIIIENNFLSENSEIINTILCGGRELFQNLLPTVEENTTIGEELTQITKNGANEDFPQYIYGGITLIGNGVQIPRSFKVESNCYIESKVAKSSLKTLRRLERGKSILLGR